MTGVAEEVSSLLSGLTVGEQVDMAQPSSLFKVANVFMMICLEQAFVVTGEMRKPRRGSYRKERF